MYHFTHLDNLGDLLGLGALLSDTEVQKTNLLSVEAGHQGIKDRRRSIPVSCEPGGVVADYVPFYFSTRSPMMYSLWRGNVPTFTGTVKDLVYLVTDVSTLVAADLSCVFSDRNAAVAFADFSNDVSVLGDLASNSPQSDFIDWNLMRSQQWNTTQQHPDRMERRMAEALVHEQMPLQLLRAVGVPDEQRKTMVEQMFGNFEYDIPIVTRPDWYYP
ncbi:DUF4433 domain-containing protein [Ilumatobacter sp.]|uniref:type II toxin-antitoxin system toxin DNA ADP-ribosyl transferase DarT n=1 Tax=Ilumatobacter sp. TaxID=1967498 RepID=UPI0037516BF0